MLILACVQTGLRSRRIYPWFTVVLLSWHEPLPTDRKSTAGLSSVIKLKNGPSLKVKGFVVDTRANECPSSQSTGRRIAPMVEHNPPTSADSAATRVIPCQLRSMSPPSVARVKTALVGNSIFRLFRFRNISKVFSRL
jgi:hypothetical protein